MMTFDGNMLMEMTNKDMYRIFCRVPKETKPNKINSGML